MRLSKFYKIFVISMAMALGAGNMAISGPHGLIVPATPENTVILLDIHEVMLQKFIGPMLKAAAYFPKKYEMIKGVSRELLAAMYQLRNQKNVTGELFARVALQHNNKALAEFIIMLASIQFPIEGTVETIKELKARGFKLYIASNIGPISFAKLQETKPELFNSDIFELEFSQIANYEPGKMVCKPDPLFFEELKAKVRQHQRSLGNNKELNMLFIDDSKKNIDAAVKSGLHVVHFKNPVQLKESLKQQFQINL